MKHQKQPLYRKVNTRARGVHHRFGGDYAHDRSGEKDDDAKRGKMHGRQRRGLDYTPLFKFLQNSVGKKWDDVFSEATARLDRDVPIFWLVARRDEDKEAYVRCGDNSYYSGLYVDDDGILQRVDDSVDETTLSPSCSCCTHTFNGKRFTLSF